MDALNTNYASDLSLSQLALRAFTLKALAEQFQAAVTVPLGLCGTPFRTASKGYKQTKGALGNLLDPIERARDSAKAPGEKSAKKREIKEITPGIIADVRKAILNLLIP